MNKEKIVPELRFPEFVKQCDWTIRTIGDFIISHKGGASLTPKDFVSKPACEVIPKKAIIDGGWLKLDIENPTYCTNQFFNSNIQSVIDNTYLITTLRDLVPSGPTIGYIVKYKGDQKYILAQGVYGLKVNQSIYSDYLIHYSNTNRYRILVNSIMVGSTQVHIRNGEFFKVPIPIPTIKEQQKIAACLSSLDNLLNTETEKLTLLKDHKKGLLQQLFPAEGETKPQFRFPEFEKDGDWEERPLSQICHYSNGGSHENKVVANGKYNLISLNSIDIEGNLKSEMKRVDQSNNSLIKNDIVMVLSDVAHGNFLGLSAVMPNNNYVLNQRMAGLRIKKNKDVNVQYLRLIINNNQKYFKKKGQGSSQQNLSKPSVEKFPVLLSSNPREQQKIANCLSSIDDLVETQTKRIKRLKAHKKGLMQQMFPTIKNTNI